MFLQPVLDKSKCVSFEKIKISSLVIELSPRLLDCLPLGSSGAGAGPDVMVSPGSMDSQSWSPSNPGLQRQHL